MSIKVEQITKIYGQQKALNNLSFKVNKGEIVGFLGPNGAGKSTLMKILCGYIPATSGNALVNNFDVKTNAIAVKKRVGYLLEHNPLYDDMYVKEYLLFNASIYKVHKDNVSRVIDITGLKPEAHKKIKALSKGYKQRVGLANALLHNPDVLILDEPTTGLDPNQLLDIRQLISHIGKDKTVFLSTHIMQEVEAICNRVIIINKGEIVADNSLKELRESSKQIIAVEFDNTVEELVLKKLPHVEKLINMSECVYEITFSTSDDMRPKIFDFAQDNNLKILQLNTKTTSLESLFRELTLE